MKKTAPLTAFVAAGILALTGCQSGTPDTESETDAGSGEAPSYEVASDVELDDSDTWTAADEAGTLRMGVKFDQPGLGNLATDAENPEGFDIEMGKMIAASLGFEEDEVEWVETVPANQGPFLQSGQVDLAIGSYTINDERKEVVDFAGPYYMAGQDLMVAADEEDITGPDTLADKTVCSTVGSTPAQRIETEYPDAELVTYDVNSKCVSDLRSGAVDAVTTDDAILRGYAAQNENEMKIVGEQFSEEPYGVGIPKGDDALREAVNDALEESADNGLTREVFEYTLGDSSGVEFPEVDRY